MQREAYREIKSYNHVNVYTLNCSHELNKIPDHMVQMIAMEPSLV